MRLWNTGVDEILSGGSVFWLGELSESRLFAEESRGLIAFCETEGSKGEAPSMLIFIPAPINSSLGFPLSGSNEIRFNTDAVPGATTDWPVPAVSG
jgi:hypothetical protein